VSASAIAAIRDIVKGVPFDRQRSAAIRDEGFLDRFAVIHEIQREYVMGPRALGARQSETSIIVECLDNGASGPRPPVEQGGAKPSRTRANPPLCGAHSKPAASHTPGPLCANARGGDRIYGDVRPKRPKGPSGPIS
jgi:hypothetical protein